MKISISLWRARTQRAATRPHPTRRVARRFPVACSWCRSWCACSTWSTSSAEPARRCGQTIEFRWGPVLGRAPVNKQLLTLSFPSSKGTFSQPFKDKCIIEVVRVGMVIFHLRLSYEKPSSWYCVMYFSWCGSRRNFTLIILGSKKVNPFTTKNLYEVGLVRFCTQNRIQNRRKTNSSVNGA